MDATGSQEDRNYNSRATAFEVVCFVRVQSYWPSYRINGKGWQAGSVALPLPKRVPARHRSNPSLFAPTGQ